MFLNKIKGEVFFLHDCNECDLNTIFFYSECGNFFLLHQKWTCIQCWERDCFQFERKNDVNGNNKLYYFLAALYFLINLCNAHKLYPFKLKAILSHTKVCAVQCIREYSKGCPHVVRIMWMMPFLWFRRFISLFFF